MQISAPAHRQTAIWLAFALTFFNFTGANAARVILTLYALELDASPFAVGVLGGMFYLMPLLLSLPIGAVADRYGPRGLLMAGALCGIGSLVLPYFMRTLPAFFAAAALSGLALAFFHVTLQNIIGLLSEPHERPRNFSNFSLTGAVTNFVGPLVAGIAIDYAGHAVACLVLSALPATAALLLAFRGNLLPGGSGHATGGSGTLKSLANPAVLRMLGISTLVQLGTDVFQFYLPIYGHAQGLSASAIGAVLAAFALASFVVRLYLPDMVKRVPPEKLLAWSFYAGAFGFVLVPFTGSALTLGTASFIFGLGMGISTPLTVMLMYSYSAEGRSGQTLGLRLTAANFMRVVGPVLFGAVGSAIGLPPVFWINAVLMGAGGIMARPRAKAGD